MSDGAAGELLRRVVPAGVFTAEIVDHGQPVPLRDGERAAVASVGARRLRDFTLGRDCAHRALARLGAATDAIPRGEDGAPRWPSGIRGSITHTRGFAAAAVAPATHIAAIGIDAERIAELTGNVAVRVFGAKELACLEVLPSPERTLAAITLFSAKEACFKAGAVASLRFREMEVRLAGGELHIGVGGKTFAGRWAVSGDLVVTAVMVPAA